MTNEQLWLAIGAPMLFNGLVFIVMVTNMNARFASVENRFTSIESRLASVEQRIELLIGATHELDNRLSRLEERLEHR